MHTIGNYVFDSARLIIYKSDKEIVDMINATFPNDIFIPITSDSVYYQTQ